MREINLENVQPMFAPADLSVSEIIKEQEALYNIKMSLVPIEGNEALYEKAYNSLLNVQQRHPNVRTERVGDEFAFNKWIGEEFDCKYVIYMFEVGEKVDVSAIMVPDPDPVTEAVAVSPEALSEAKEETVQVRSQLVPLELGHDQKEYLRDICKAVLNVDVVISIPGFVLLKFPKKPEAIHWTELVFIHLPLAMFRGDKQQAAIHSQLLLGLYINTGRHPIDILYDETSALRNGTEGR